MKILKILTLLADIGILVFVLFAAFRNGIEENEMFVLGTIIFLLLNIYFISTNNEMGWVGLFLKRKALEEKQKIKKLEL